MACFGADYEEVVGGVEAGSAIGQANFTSTLNQILLIPILTLHLPAEKLLTIRRYHMLHPTTNSTVKLTISSTL